MKYEDAIEMIKGCAVHTPEDYDGHAFKIAAKFLEHYRSRLERLEKGKLYFNSVDGCARYARESLEIDNE